ncbi:MAG: AbrB/MazE/SpoVT family DNA-binding domain-containing protein [Panacagrimonas sp.]
MNSPTVIPITVDASGRLVLPKAMRDELNLRPGTKLKAEIVAGRIELTPEDDDCELVEKDGLWVIRSRSGRKFDAVAAIREDREDRIRHLRGR